MAIEFMGEQLEEHDCPHCKQQLTPMLGPPESGWGVILVCQNNECPHYAGSKEDIVGKREDSNIGCRYAVNPENGYKPFNMIAWCPPI